MTDVASLRSQFPVARDTIFLNHAGVAPTSLRAADAVRKFMVSLAELGRPSFDDWEALADECRTRFARLIGADADEIAFVRNTSHGLSLLAAGLDWRPGDRVAFAPSVEYPSNVYPWIDLERRGVAALDRIVPRNGTVTPEGAAAAMKTGTRVLAVSSAQYATGAVTDLPALGELCQERGVLLCVDGIQSVGVLSLDAKQAGVHFLSADSHKWLLGMMGIGAVFADRSIIGQVRPPLLGWRSTTGAFDFDRVHFELKDTAGRYEEGSLAYPLIAGFSEALALLEEAGSESIEARVRSLVDDLGNRLEELGCETGPPPEQRRHILVFRHPGTEGERLLDGLAERGVVASLRRGWIRASPHFYNTPQEMEAAAAAVRETIAGRTRPAYPNRSITATPSSS